MLSVDDPLSHKDGDSDEKTMSHSQSSDLLEMHKSRRKYISEKLEKRQSEEHYLKY